MSERESGSAIEDRKGNEKIKQTEAELRLVRMKKDVQPSKGDKAVKALRFIKHKLDTM